MGKLVNDALQSSILRQSFTDQDVQKVRGHVKLFNDIEKALRAISKVSFIPPFLYIKAGNLKPSKDWCRAIVQSTSSSKDENIHPGYVQRLDLCS
jgi:hypothetical protein